METTEIKLDIEAVNSTIEKIKYFSCLPSHIKGTAAVLDDIGSKDSVYDGLCSPAHVINGSITAVHGRINIPDINTITRLYEIDKLPLSLINP